ncbi:hypothetical protein [Nocardia sp. NPDC050412]|uniref:hypothetical protein n=1 Tax=Nocardia sp. NPDC050412 TaxID=3364320 RepID=UPI00378C52DF
MREGTFTAADPTERDGTALLGMCQSIARWYQPAGPLAPQELAARYIDIALAIVCAQRPARGRTTRKPGEGRRHMNDDICSTISAAPICPRNPTRWLIAAAENSLARHRATWLKPSIDAPSCGLRTGDGDRADAEFVRGANGDRAAVGDHTLENK